MTKSRKPAKTQMPSRGLTDPEVDAALQLIHLSGGEDSSDDNNHNNNGRSEANSVGNHHQNQEICSGRMTVEDGNLDDQDFPPKNRRFRSLVDIYSKTAPILSKKRGGPGPAAGKKNKIRRTDVFEWLDETDLL